MKRIFVSAILVFGARYVYAQGAAAGGDVVPIAIALDQVLRVNVTGGGNIEFVFNSIDDYKSGIANSSFYDTRISIASSQNWSMNFGPEDPNLIGTENPANIIALNNIGFNFDYTAAMLTCCGVGSDIDASVSNAVAVGGGVTNGLPLASVTIMTCGSCPGGTNAGDVNDIAFTINWECGTTSGGGTTLMNGTLFIEQTFVPDRYITNIIIDIDAL